MVKVQDLWHRATTNGTGDIWWILEGQDYPGLWWEKMPEN